MRGEKYSSATKRSQPETRRGVVWVYVTLWLWKCSLRLRASTLRYNFNLPSSPTIGAIIFRLGLVPAHIVRDTRTTTRLDETNM